ncbi:tubulin monoglutamylase TTLL4 isoform X1 [Nothobranchius furzeri]|uniref:Tubulin tyrosine ligase like 4 n=2 Tax=Nothobranchius furzeri TaxID=105023 RepID=A0A1A7ZYG3_NOTFU|nr:tubulin tyrosine ligase like 4 [Nothobranchius furzeri]
MPTNQSSPWTGGIHRVCPGANVPPTSAPVPGAATETASHHKPLKPPSSKTQTEPVGSLIFSAPPSIQISVRSGSVTWEKVDINRSNTCTQSSGTDGFLIQLKQSNMIQSSNQVLEPSGLSWPSSVCKEFQLTGGAQESVQNPSSQLGLSPSKRRSPPGDTASGLQVPEQCSSPIMQEAADRLSSPPVPLPCLSVGKTQATASSTSRYISKKPKTKSTTRPTNAARRSTSAKTATKCRNILKNQAARSCSNSQLVIKGASRATTSKTQRMAPHCKTRQDPPNPNPLGRSNSLPSVFRTAQLDAVKGSADVVPSPAGALVGSVTSQISAIQLTRRGQPSSSPSTTEDQVIEEAQPWRSGCKMQVDGVEEEPPDWLENLFSDHDGSDCSVIDASSTASTPPASVEEPMVVEDDNGEERAALVPSLFPLMPPTLYFSTANEKVELLPAEQRRLLKWKMSTVTPNIVKHTIARSHFKATKRSHDWLGCWGHHMKSPGFKALGEHQKLNHFPGTFEIGRKDRLWRNLSKMQLRFGKKEFSFLPRTFILPQDIKLLRKAWEDGGSTQKWIVKPPASARGMGIQVIHKWSQMPKKRPLLVQKYLQKPYLIGGNKFDLRIYVYVPSYDPLRIYMFSDGLVRFASCKYSSSTKTLGNKFMHLTNYSVNKKNSEYQTNSDNKACQGHKWALKALWLYLGSKGINTTLIWGKIKDIVIKTIIASEPYVNNLLKMHVKTTYSCHELFGFDIMLDENLKPWILEVNISPSLHSNSELDISIKGQMIRDLLNLAGFQIPQREKEISSCTSASSSSNRERTKPDLSADEKVKRAFFLTQPSADQDLVSSVLDVLTPEDVHVLAESEDELSRRGEFERIFPSQSSSRYLRFFECLRYPNILLDQWEQKYWNNRTKCISLLKSFCEKGVHLGTSDPAHMWSRGNYNFWSEREKPTVMSPSRVLVSHQRATDEDLLDSEVATVSSLPGLLSSGSSPGSSVSSSACSSPQPSLTQNLLSQQFSL